MADGPYQEDRRLRRLSHRLLVGACALATGSLASAVVTRHDVAPERYLLAESALPQLVDMPGVGHGVLIAPDWVVTAAHTIQSEVRAVTIAGQERAVARVIVHPGYRSTPQDMINRALASKDATEVMAFLAANHDIALIRLREPVSDVRPIPIYTGGKEMGRLVEMVGKGATGTGLSGVAPGSSQRGALRRGYNRIDRVEERWISYTFDQGRKALRLEGMSGSGDSGGPLLLRQGGRRVLAGLTSWQNGNPDLGPPPSRYGQGTVAVRLSHYAGWIAEVQAQDRDQPPTGG